MVMWNLHVYVVLVFVITWLLNGVYTYYNNLVVEGPILMMFILAIMVMWSLHVEVLLIFVITWLLRGLRSIHFKIWCEGQFSINASSHNFLDDVATISTPSTWCFGRRSCEDICDNQAKNPTFHRQTKPGEVDYHLIWYKLFKGLVFNQNTYSLGVARKYLHQNIEQESAVTCFAKSSRWSTSMLLIKGG